MASLRETLMSEITKAGRVEIASRWTTALSKAGVTPLKALAAVLDDDVRTNNFVGKDAVLHWFETFPGMSLFRTGTWHEPSVEGDVVTFVNMFDERASAYSATLEITVGASGLITRASMTMLAAPDPLGTVINRVWGRRAAIDRLDEHLAATYGVAVKGIDQLDHGVFRADLAKGGPWIVRVFPSDRPIADVEGDAAILRHLEEKGFPAERVVGDVSAHEGQGVLVTAFVKGPKPTPSAAIFSRLGDLAGRLATMKGGPKPLRRPAGGLHLYTVDCTVPSEIATARASLEAATFRGKTDKAWERLAEGLRAADDFASLPVAPMHPDPANVNAIATKGGPTLIDWAGAGAGPRVLGLGLLLVGCVSGKTFNQEWTDALIGAYTKHVRLEGKELDVLEAAVAHRMLIHEAYSWSVGKATQRKPASRKDWPHNNDGIAKMADHIRQGWA